MPPRRRSTWAGLLLLVAAGCSPAGGPGDKAAAPGQGAAAETGSFQVALVEERRLDRAIEVTGSLRPLDQTAVSVKVPGRLQSIEVDLGSFVLEGDLIARLEASDYELRVKQAEAALGQARARVGLPLEGEDDHVEAEAASSVKEARAVLEEAVANRTRIEALTRQGILSAAELETATATFKVASSRYEDALETARIRMAQLRQARAVFDIARQELAETYIRAPFDGAVQERRGNIGEYLTVGRPVVVMVRVDPLRLRVEVSERDASRVRTGQVVKVTVEGDPQEYTGQVKRFSPAITEGSRTLVVEADVPAGGRLRPGSFARARILTERDDLARIIPDKALLTFAGIEKVFAVVDGKAVEKRVATGMRGEGWVEITEGLEAGETVVIAPGSLRAGESLRIVPPGTTGSATTAHKGS